jgi:alkanesulfonate monooxygenase SsuD/methylene tetrahydromethanopterin reductase-like flavin-dependent oxidoreductase (luciferase family)
LRVAEDVCVLDNISNGRVDITVAAGYVPSEFKMLGVNFKHRTRLLEEGIPVLRAAFTGEAFDYQGRRVRVSPKPVQPGGPKIMVGGGVTAAALRAARLGDGFFPTVARPELVDCYRAECARLGRHVGRVISSAAGFIHVSRDPIRDWPRIGKHLLHDFNAYAKWARESGAVTPYMHDVSDLDTLKKTGVYLVLTPEQCLAFMEGERAAGRCIIFNPLCGGLDPDIAWESLELLAAEVLPKFQRSASA